MKKCFLLFLLCLMVFAVSCADKSTDPNGGGDTGGGSKDEFYAEVKAHLDGSGDPNAIYTTLNHGWNHHYPWLAWASMNGYVDSAELLIDAGADLYLNVVYTATETLTDKDSAGFTANVPLRLAAYNGHIEVVKLIIAKDKNTINYIFDTKTSYESSLFGAAWGGHLDIVKLLLDNGANTIGAPLVRAAMDGRMDILELLLTKATAADVNCLDVGYEGTPLACAILGLNPDIALRLLDFNGIDVDLVPRAGSYNTPLMYACGARVGASGANKDVVVKLLAKGADVNTKYTWSTFAKTAWDFANDYNLTEIVAILEAAGGESASTL